MRTAEYWIEQLHLQAHPEGGFFAETYRAAEDIPRAGLPARFGGARPISTCIYFLLREEDVSHFHRIRADETWHFYAGGPLTLHVLTAEGEWQQHPLGQNPERGQRFQRTIPAGLWFGATVDPGSGYALVGCTVAPGFVFEDFEMARRADLMTAYPRHAGIVERLTSA